LKNTCITERKKEYVKVRSAMLRWRIVLKRNFKYIVRENIDFIHIVAYLLKARAVEIEKQPLLWSDWVSTYAVTSRNNRGGVASCVFCGSALRLYDSTDQVQFSEWVSAIEGSVVEC
jgi:hypothetical protein